jgi:lipoprotein NlpD
MRQLFVVLVVALAGCATTATAPVVERTREPPPPRVAAPSPVPPPVAQPALPEAPPGSYVVRRGDTLYSIALDNGLDYRELAAWNSLSDPNVIREGQVLSLKPPPSEAQVRPITGLGGVQVRPLGEAETAPRGVPARPPGGLEPAPQPLPAEPMLVTEPKGLKLPYSEQSLALLGKPPAAAVLTPPLPSQPEVKPEARPKAEAVESGLDWSWPANGKIVATFSDPVSKGVDIAGRKGEPVTASASGRVVYIGEGLRGYGKLVIIKHNDTFLSAYAHNDAILVKEGQSVVKGQKIAEIGSTGTDQTKLHFEIRQLGKPVDPLKFLPERPL